MPLGSGGDRGCRTPAQHPAPRTPAGLHRGGSPSARPLARSFPAAIAGAVLPVPPPRSLKAKRSAVRPPPTSSPSPPSRPRRNSEYRGFHALYRIQRRSEVWKLHPGSGGGGRGEGYGPRPTRGQRGFGARWGLQPSLPTWGAKLPLWIQRMRFWG